MSHQRALSRRDFLRLTAVTATGVAMAACELAATSQIITVEERVPAEKQVVKEVPPEEVVVQAVEKPARIPEPVKLEVWTGWGPATTSNMQVILDRFRQANPGCSCELTMAADENTFLSAAAAGESPDLYVSTWNMFIARWAEEKAVCQLDPYIDATGFDLNSQLRAGIDGCRWIDGQLYGMAWGTHCTGLMWNKGHFQEAGLDPEAGPNTWEEVDLFAEKLTKRQGPDLGRAGYVPTFGCCLDVPGYCISFGGSLYNKDYTKLTLNTPEMKRALDYMKSYYDKYGGDAIDRLQATFGYGPQQGHYSGKISLFLAGEWVPRYGRVYGLKWTYGIGKVPAPADRPDLINKTPVSGTASVIPSGAKQPDAAWELFAFLVGPWATAARTKDGGCIPTHVGSLRDPHFTEDPDLRAYIALAFDENAYAPALTPTAMDLYEELGSAMQLIMHGKMTIEAAMKEVERKLQPTLDKVMQAG